MANLPPGYIGHTLPRIISRCCELQCYNSAMNHHDDMTIECFHLL